MDLLENTEISYEKLFWGLYNTKTEEELDAFIDCYPEIFNENNWAPLGNNTSNFGVIENQHVKTIDALLRDAKARQAYAH
jgi:hypothetical protein